MEGSLDQQMEKEEQSILADKCTENSLPIHLPVLFHFVCFSTFDRLKKPLLTTSHFTCHGFPMANSSLDFFCFLSKVNLSVKHM